MKNSDIISKYSTFIYDNFKVEYFNDYLHLEFFYEIKDLEKFTHKLDIPIKRKDINKAFVEQLVFNIGMIELVSYYKLTVANKIVVNCGSLNGEQKNFFKKIYYHGLGEFFYVNNLNPDYNTFLKIDATGKTYNEECLDTPDGYLIAIGGGKDSCVTLKLLQKENIECFIINPKDVMLNCAYAAGYKDSDICSVKRYIDPKLIELNNKGFFNGHTPFSAMVAFVSYLTAYLNNKNEIVLSNEASANEANVNGTKINHQYSKSYEFEKDFQEYAKKYLKGNIKYYSLLRGLSEYQIGMLFSKYKEFHPIFKSCNVGSKSIPWKWCGSCAKCLFVYSLLAPHLYKDDLVNIFEKDLFEDKTLLTTFKELLGYENIKPFDCVGTFEEINYAITKTIKKLNTDKLPILLKYYKDNYYNEEILNKDLEHTYNNENSLSMDKNELIKGAILND